MVFSQGGEINYTSGYSWRAYTGTTPPVCSGKLCPHFPVHPWDGSFAEFAAWKSTSGDPNSASAFLNFRVLFPPGYDVNDSKTYPLVIMLHGAGESGRIWTDHFNYEPTDSLYDSNGDQLKYGAREHLAASTKPPSDPGSCQAIVVFPQVSYSGSWGELSGTEISESEQMLLGFIETQLIPVYHADPNRLVMHGLSIGAREIWSLATKRPDLFAGIMLMSAVPADLETTTDVLVSMPMWIFQGGEDTNPSPAAAQTLVEMFQSKGGLPRYTLYPDRGHETWTQAYKEPGFFSWIMSRDQRNIYVASASTELCSEAVRLSGPTGMSGYQWTFDGVELDGRTGQHLTVARAGTFTVKFQRPSGEWVESFPVQMTVGDGCTLAAIDDIDGVLTPYPNPTRDIVHVHMGQHADVAMVQVLTVLGQVMNVPLEAVSETELTVDLSSVSPGTYIIRFLESNQQFRVVKQ
jgi:predicted esterase